MTPQEAFRFGFLLRCAEDNLSADQVAERVKSAEDSSLFGGLARAGMLAALTPMLVGGGIGAGLGYGAELATAPRIDTEDIKAQELTTAHRLLAQQLAQRNKMRQLTQSRGGRSRAFAF